MFFRILFTLLLFTFVCCAQTKIEIIQAGELKYNKKTHNARKLIGDVILKHDNAFMYCDSAYLYEKSNKMDAFSNVKINQGDSIEILGNYLEYDGNSKIAFIKGNVSLIDNEIKLTSNEIIYNKNNNIAYYYSGGFINTFDNVLESKKGTYNTLSKMAYFKKNVVLTNPEYVFESDTLHFFTTEEIAFFYGPTTITSGKSVINCRKGKYDTQKEEAWFTDSAKLTTDSYSLFGDSLFYNGINNVSEAFYNTKLIDQIDDYIIEGNYAHYFENKDSCFVTNKPVLSVLLDDTLFLHADTLISILDSNDSKIALVFHDVKIYKPNLQGKCDSLVYSFSNNKMEMFDAPILWSDVNQITSDKLDFYLSKNQLDSMHLLGEPFICSKEDSLSFNQIKGKEMTGYFLENKLKTLDVRGNGHTIYFVKDDDNLVGINITYCSNMKISVLQNEINQITFLTKPEAKVYPEKELSIDERFLEKFNWRDNERPLKKEDIFN